MKAERNQGRSREEAYARDVADPKGGRKIDKPARNKDRSLEEAYAPEIGFRRIDRDDLGRYVIVAIEAGKRFAKDYGIMIPSASTSSKKGGAAESQTIGDITINDDLADDIASIMERLEKGIAAESGALDRLLHRMAAAESPAQR